MKILAVDDSMLYLNITEKYLNELLLENEIIICNDPQKVKSIIDENMIDILLLDVIMPVLSGFDILKLLRDNHAYDDIPIIMLTSLNDDVSFRKCFELGANDYIAKPINVDEFKVRIKAAIKSRENYNYLKEIARITEQHNKELKEINSKLIDAKFSLAQSDKMAAIGQLAAGIAHEINNPLGFVSSNFEILNTYFLRISEYLKFIDAKWEELAITDNDSVQSILLQINEKSQKLKINIIKEEIDGLLADSVTGIQRVTEIVQTLKVFARSSQNEEKDFHALSEIMKEVQLISRNEVKYTSEMKIDVPNDLEVYCNKGQIGQVLLNVIMNSSQAIRSQAKTELGNIEISTKVEDGFVCISIADDGPGIPEENLDKVFEPFFTTKEVGQGTGLGLSISYDIIVTKHNGKVELKSELGCGTEFTIKLPIKTENN